MGILEKLESFCIVYTLGPWIPECLDPGRLDLGQMDSWTLDAWTQKIKIAFYRQRYSR